MGKKYPDHHLVAGIKYLCLQSLLDSSLELRTSLELDNLLSGDSDNLTSCGVLTLTGSTLSNAQSGNTGNSNLLASSESALNSLDSGLYSLLSINLAQTSGLSNLCDQLSLIHTYKFKN